MENLKRELEALQAIESVPMPPQGIPGVFTDRQSRVKIPPSVVDYLKKAEKLPKLDKDFKIGHLEYLELLKEHGISNIGYAVTRLVVLDTDKNISKKKS